MGYSLGSPATLATTTRRYRRSDRLGEVSGTPPAAPTGSTTSSTQQNLQSAQQALATARQAGNLLNQLESFFNPGKTRDEQRLQREVFFRDSAVAGSITAARYIMGGLLNVASNEMPDYTSAAAYVEANAPDVWAAANAQGPIWNTNDVAGDPNKSAMIADVKKDLLVLQKYVPAPPTSTGGSTGTTTGTSSSGGTGGATTPGAHTLPGMTTTAPFNYLPILLAGALAIIPALVRKH